MHYILFFITFFAIHFNVVYGQEIPGDLIKLATYTLNKNPDIATGALAIQNAAGTIKVQRSTFDYQLTSVASITKNKRRLFDADPISPIVNGNVSTNGTEVSLGLQKALRSGIRTSFTVDYGRLSNNFPFNQFNEEVGANQSDHTITTTLSVTQPLIRGRGKKIATALETSSELALENAKYSYELTNAFEILQTGIAYWQYVGAYKRLTIFRANEERVRNVLAITLELVQADKKPAGDLAQIRADLANQERQTKIAEQQVYNARINLGRAIGIEVQESEHIGIPMNEFPSIPESKYATAVSDQTMLAIAANHRKDIAAFHALKKGLALQLELARNHLKPTLDLSAFASYGAMNTGNGFQKAFSTLGNREGSDYTIGLRLNFAFPLNNNLARGSFLQQQAALSEQEVSLHNLQRNIDLNVHIALNNLRNSVAILTKAEETLQYYQEVFSNEQVKFQNGLTTLLNLILFQERLTFAQLDYLAAQQQFATAIINLRFETGTLVKKNADEEIVLRNTKVFYEIPTL